MTDRNYRIATPDDERAMLPANIDKSGVSPDDFDVKFFVNLDANEIDTGAILDLRRGMASGFVLVTDESGRVVIDPVHWESDEMLGALRAVDGTSAG